MKASFVFTSMLMLCLSSAQAQTGTIRYTAEDEIIWAGVDRASDLIIQLKSGVVEKINLAGKRVGRYKFDQVPTLIDPLDGAQAFFFQRNSGKYGTLSSDLAFATLIDLEPSLAVTPWLICPMLHELWILDVGDFTLKKTASNAATQGWETLLPPVVSRNPDDLIYMKEYQNYVFLLDRSAGVHVFNSLGRYVKTISEKGATYFGFLGGETYFANGNKIIYVDLFTGDIRNQEISLCRSSFPVDENIFLVYDRYIEITPFKTQ
ncbi:MAG TPA: hypothetical protein PLX35_11695 [Cyclobacteriaceae bacterium]|nr:hypothetical protein [Cyclobacteriaceae bacterium]